MKEIPPDVAVAKVLRGLLKEGIERAVENLTAGIFKPHPRIRRYKDSDSKGWLIDGATQVLEKSGKFERIPD